MEYNSTNHEHTSGKYSDTSDPDFAARLEEEISSAGGEWQDEFPNAAGRTAFDAPNSKDNTISVLVPPQNINKMASRALVRIESRPKEQGGDGRHYLGVVVQGPFSEPDGLRADAPTLVAMGVKGTMFMPRYHGRVQVAIIGEILSSNAQSDETFPETNGVVQQDKAGKPNTIIPPRFRPLPNSPVYPLSQEETIVALNILGDIQLGLAVGYEDMPVAISAKRKDVFPRHMAVLGTTGGGKSTTVSGLIGQLAQANVAVIVLDTEGEYTHIMHPTEDAKMLQALSKRQLSAKGITNIGLRSLVGRDTRNEEYEDSEEFGLEFSELSPYAIIEILGFNDAQEERFLRAYDIARGILMKLGIYPADDKEKEEMLELDEQETGIPRLTLQMFYDVVRACAEQTAGETIHKFFCPQFEEKRDDVIQVIKSQHKTKGDSFSSWRKVQGAVARLLRLKTFDEQKLPNFVEMTNPGRVTIIDLSGTDSKQINNLVISQILLSIRKQQEENYQNKPSNDDIKRVVIIVEEAHEFLAASRIKQMQNLLDQVTRIARRGRKRWLGLVFVSQSPEDFPDEVLGLVNNFILHKITNATVINRLSRAIGGIDEGLWDRVSNLEPGVAIVKAGGLTQPMLVAIDPTPHKLLMVD